jgi:hypothetical protein
MYVPFEQFEKAVRALVALREHDGVRLMIYRSGAVVVSVHANDETLDEALESASLSAADLDEAREDIADALTAAVSGASEDEVAEIRAAPRSKIPDDEVEDPETARSKVRMVLESFDIESLRVRHWLRRTSKTNAFGDIDWEVADKVADDYYLKPHAESALFVTVRLTAEEPVARAFTSYTFSADEEDLAYLTSQLSRLREELKTQVNRQ